jgi:chromosome segregation ATPase
MAKNNGQDIEALLQEERVKFRADKAELETKLVTASKKILDLERSVASIPADKLEIDRLIAVVNELRKNEGKLNEGLQKQIAKLQRDRKTDGAREEHIRKKLSDEVKNHTVTKELFKDMTRQNEEANVNNVALTSKTQKVEKEFARLNALNNSQKKEFDEKLQTQTDLAESLQAKVNELQNAALELQNIRDKLATSEKNLGVKVTENNFLINKTEEDAKAVNEARLEIERLANELDKVQREIVRVKSEKSDVEKKLEEKKAAELDLQKQLQGYVDATKQREALKLAANEIRELTGKNSALEKQLADLATQQGSTSQELSKTITDLKTQLQASAAENQRIIQEVATKTDELQVLKASSQQISKDLEQQTTRADDAEQSIITTQEKLQNERDHNASLQTQLDALTANQDATAKQQDTELQQVKSDLETAKEKGLESAKKITGLEEQLEAMSANLLAAGENTTAMEEAKAQNQELEAEKIKLIAKIQQAEENVEGLQQALDNTNLQKEQLQQANDTMLQVKAERDDLNRKKLQLEKQLAELQAELEKQKTIVINLSEKNNEEILKYQTKQVENEGQIARFTKELEDATNGETIKKLTDELEEANAKLAKVTSQLEAATKKNEAVIKKRDDLKAIIKKFMKTKKIENDDDRKTFLGNLEQQISSKNPEISGGSRNNGELYAKLQKSLASKSLEEKKKILYHIHKKTCNS